MAQQASSLVKKIIHKQEKSLGSHIEKRSTTNKDSGSAQGIHCEPRRRRAGVLWGILPTLEGVSIRTGASEYGTPVVDVSDVAGGFHLAIFVLPFDHRLMKSFKLVRSVPLGVTVTVQGKCRVFSEDGTVLVIKQCKILAP